MRGKVLTMGGNNLFIMLRVIINFGLWFAAAFAIDAWSKGLSKTGRKTKAVMLKISYPILLIIWFLGELAMGSPDVSLF